MDSVKKGRSFLKADLWEKDDMAISDQQKGLPCPLPQKQAPADSVIVELKRHDKLSLKDTSVRGAIENRVSIRQFSAEPVGIDELSFLLWATQGVKQVLAGGAALMRTAPSAGARHAFETYLAVNNIEGLRRGLYRYLSIDHKLSLLRRDDNIAAKVASACCRQDFIATSAVVFIWTAVPYRMEWRYGTKAHKLIALDAGHVCQNLYIACESVGMGTCAIAAYYQSQMDSVVGADGEDEFVIYAAPVGYKV